MTKLEQIAKGLRIGMTIAKDRLKNVGGEVINLDIKPRDMLPTTTSEQDTFNFARPNNIMEADWDEPVIESGRFGDHDEWNENIKRGMIVPQLISSEEDYSQENYTDDIGNLKDNPNYAKVDYGISKTANIDNFPFEDINKLEDE